MEPKNSGFTRLHLVHVDTRKKKDLFSPNEARGRAQLPGRGVAVGDGAGLPGEGVGRQSETTGGRAPAGEGARPPREATGVPPPGARACGPLAAGVTRTAAGGASTRGRPLRAQGRECV